MRQAGRYLPEYQSIRQQVSSFTELCKTPELACEVTLQPIRRFALDAAIIFTDILTIPEAMGQQLTLVPGQGPFLDPAIREPRQIEQLPSINIEELDYVMRAITMVDQTLSENMPLLGFTGSPWTLACYMIEGHGDKLFKNTKTMLYQHPEWLASLLDKLAEVIARYLIAQIQAGVDALMIFDSWGGILSPEAYQRYSLYYIENIVTRVRAEYDTPITLFTKGGGLWLENQAKSGVDGLSIDWMTDLAEARQRVGHNIALQGNLDPTALFGDAEQVKQLVKQICRKQQNQPGYIFNLGHGVLPETPIDNVHAMIEAVH